VQFLIELLGVKARTSQSRFPLSATLYIAYGKTIYRYF